MLNFLGIMEDTTDTIMESMDILVTAKDMDITTATDMEVLEVYMEVIVESKWCESNVNTLKWLLVKYYKNYNLINFFPVPIYYTI